MWLCLATDKFLAGIFSEASVIHKQWRCMCKRTLSWWTHRLFLRQGRRQIFQRKDRERNIPCCTGSRTCISGNPGLTLDPLSYTHAPHQHTDLLNDLFPDSHTCGGEDWTSRSGQRTQGAEDAHDNAFLVWPTIHRHQRRQARHHGRRCCKFCPSSQQYIRCHKLLTVC